MAYGFIATDDALDSESPWDDNASDAKHNEDAQWAKLSSDFTNAGYREGITAGKESALQEGFDDGFAQVGVPLGREIGVMRGACSALVAFLTSAVDVARRGELLRQAKEISGELASIRFSDIAPRDLEAEQHALEHLAEGDEDGVDVEMQGGEEMVERRRMEKLEDMLGGMNAGGEGGARVVRPTVEDVGRLKERLGVLMEGLGLQVNWS